MLARRRRLARRAARRAAVVLRRAPPRRGAAVAWAPCRSRDRAASAGRCPSRWTAPAPSPAPSRSTSARRRRPATRRDTPSSRSPAGPARRRCRSPPTFAEILAPGARHARPARLRPARHRQLEPADAARRSTAGARSSLVQARRALRGAARRRRAASSGPPTPSRTSRRCARRRLRQARAVRRLLRHEGRASTTRPRYPDRVERLVLDSVVPPEGPDALQRSTFAAVPRVLRRAVRGRRVPRASPRTRPPTCGRSSSGSRKHAAARPATSTAAGAAHGVEITRQDLFTILADGRH